MSLPFREQWVGWDIPGIRDIDLTYGQLPLSMLPALSVPDDLSWLTPIDPRVIAAMDKDRLPGAKLAAPTFQAHEESGDAAPDYLQAEMDLIVRQAMRAHLRLPRAFLALFRSRRLLGRILDPTGCYSALPTTGITPDPFGLGGHIVRFQNDQQCCAMWYLFFPPSGSPVVLVSSETHYGMYLEEHDASDAAAAAAAIESTSLCAHSFAEFLYRFWIEGALWYKCAYGLPLSGPEDHYLRQLKLTSHPNASGS